MIFTIIRSVALSAACVHSNYHTPNKEIVIGRCGIRECKMLHLLMCSCIKSVRPRNADFMVVKPHPVAMIQTPYKCGIFNYGRKSFAVTSASLTEQPDSSACSQ